MILPNLKAVACRLGLHPKPPVPYGTVPWPLSFRCPWCGGEFVDQGPGDGR